MTTFEHGMLGGTVALLLLGPRRHSWPAIAAAAVAAALPDWDGISVLFGGAAFDRVHRVWGHNILAATLGGIVVGSIAYFTYLSAAIRSRAARMLPISWQQSSSQSPSTNDVSEISPAIEAKIDSPSQDSTPRFSARTMTAWCLICILASFTHLPGDMVYSGMVGLRDWPLKLFWPFSERGWVWPIVAWGDVAATLIFVAEMFALVRWPQRGRVIALVTLFALLCYIGLRWFLGGVGA